MNKEEVLSHCVIIVITKCEDKKLWYSKLIGKQFVAFGYNENEEEIYISYKENDSVTLHPLLLDDVDFVTGDLERLYEMD